MTKPRLDLKITADYPSAERGLGNGDAFLGDNLRYSFYPAFRVPEESRPRAVHDASPTRLPAVIRRSCQVAIKPWHFSADK